MQIFKIALASVALALTSVAVVAPVAAAQGTKVVVIDQTRIMTESAGGKDIIAKINAIEQNMTAELKPSQTALATEGKSLEAKTANMSMDAIAADAALSQEVRDYAVKAQNFNRQRKIAAAELQATERKAWSDFFTAMQGVLQEVVTESGADIMIDSSEAIYVGSSVDVTGSVITKMNAKMSTVNVVRQKIQTQPAQQ